MRPDIAADLEHHLSVAPERNRTRWRSPRPAAHVCVHSPGESDTGGNDDCLPTSEELDVHPLDWRSGHDAGEPIHGPGAGDRG
jgi:hypothetical protein